MALNINLDTDNSSEQHQPELSPLQKLESNYYSAPVQLDSEEFSQYQHQIDLYRVEARGGIAALLANTAFGQRLVKAGLKDPVKSEREKTQNQRDYYVSQLMRSEIFEDEQTASKHADSYFNALPKNRDIANFQVQLKALVEKTIAPALNCPNHHYDLAICVDYIKKDLLSTSFYKNIGLSEEEALEMLTREIVWKIKLHLATIINTGMEEDILHLINALSRLESKPTTDLSQYLEPELKRITKLFTVDKKARKTLAHFSFNKLAETISEFMTFSLFLQKLEIPQIEGDELTEYATPQMVDRSLEKAYHLSAKNYFAVVEFLLDLGLIQPDYMKSDKLLHRSIEVYFVSQHDHNSGIFRQFILPQMLKVNALPFYPKNPGEEENLLTQYDALCTRLKREKHYIIEENYTYRKPAHKDAHLDD